MAGLGAILCHHADLYERSDTESSAAVRGTDVPGYSIHQEIGHGGTGVVYRALQHGLNRVVALKIIRSPDPESRARFRIEAEAPPVFWHPNIVQIHEVGEADDGRGGCPYMALEFVEGGSLAELAR